MARRRAPEHQNAVSRNPVQPAQRSGRFGTAGRHRASGGRAAGGGQQLPDPDFAAAAEIRRRFVRTLRHQGDRRAGQGAGRRGGRTHRTDAAGAGLHERLRHVDGAVSRLGAAQRRGNPAAAYRAAMCQCRKNRRMAAAAAANRARLPFRLCRPSAGRIGEKTAVRRRHRLGV